MVVLDEAFPQITIDLVSDSVHTFLHTGVDTIVKIIVSGEFEPRNVIALSHNLGIPTSLMFMTCPGPDFAHSLLELGTRIISS